MVDYPYDVVDSVDENYTHGRTIHEGGFEVPWLKMSDESHKRSFWFLQDPDFIFNSWGYDKLPNQRYIELQNLFGGKWLSGLYYIYYSVGSEVESFKTIVNWLLGPIAGILNEWEVGADDLWDYLHPSELSEMYSIFRTTGFVRSKSKNAIYDLMHGFTISDIKNDTDYWAGDDTELDNMIQTVYNREVDKITSSDPDKITNWFIGQVMKESRGQADPSLVRSKVTTVMEGLI